MDLKEDVLELESRRDIFEHISKYPGSYMREMQEKLDMATGQLEYHLKYLEDHKLISSQMSGNKKRYFVEKEVNYPDRKLISILRQKTLRKILIMLIERGKMNFSQIDEEVDLSKSTVSFHLKKLENKGLIETRRIGRKKVYSCKNDKEIAQVLITYKSSFLDKAVDRFVETWSDMKR